MNWSEFEHAYGEASDVGPLLTEVADDDPQTCIRAFQALEERIAHQGTLYSATGPTLAAVIATLHVDRGDAGLAVCMRLTSLLRRLRAGILWARSQSDPGHLGACDRAFAGGLPVFQALRQSPDSLQAAWAIELLSFMPDPVPGLAAEELERLELEDRPVMYMTSAIVAADDDSLAERWTATVEQWLKGDQPRRKAAAMVIAITRGDPQKKDAICDDVFETLVAMAGGERWDDWEALPARENGFYADLATLLLRSGYHRAAASLPSILDLIGVGTSSEVVHIAGVAVKLAYHSAPYPGAPVADTLTPLQRASLSRLARSPRAWEAPTDLAIALSQLDLPLDPAGLLEFLGESSEGLATSQIKATGVDGDIVTIDSGLTADQVLRKLTGESESGGDA